MTVAAFAASGPASAQDVGDPFHLYPKRGITTATVAGYWTFTVEEDVIARKPINVFAALTPASSKSAYISLECHSFNPRAPGFHRVVDVATNANYVAWPPPGLPETVLRFDGNQPIKFLGVPTGAKGGAETGASEIWQRVLDELPTASALAIEVQNAQAVVNVGGFSSIKEKLLTECDAMDR